MLERKTKEEGWEVKKKRDAKIDIFHHNTFYFILNAMCVTLYRPAQRILGVLIRLKINLYTYSPESWKASCHVSCMT